MVGVAVLCAAVVIAALLVPQGEVVTLHVRDVEGRSHPTQLWIVELDGFSYLRSGGPDTRWLARLRRDPGVTLGYGHVGETPRPYIAVPIDGDPVLRARVGEAMAEKYRWADSLWSWLGDREHSIPIRLEPLPAEASP
jgi:hypothetical protein